MTRLVRVLKNLLKANKNAKKLATQQPTPPPKYACLSEQPD
ncbi:MAG: hypothetical protein ACR2OA_03980 [Rubripirellula sp.]|jgi:hypothetical protein